MLALGFKEFQRRVFTNLFVALQLAVILVLIISASSVLFYRTSFYSPLKSYIEGEGMYSQIRTEALGAMNEKDIIEKYPVIESIISANAVDATSDFSNLIAYTDNMINIYEPKMKYGKWLSECDLSNGEVYGIVSSKANLSVGDTVKITSVQFDEKDYEFKNPKYKDIEIKIVGVVDDNASLLCLDDYFSYDDNYKNLYGNVKDIDSLLITSQSQLESKHVGYSISNRKQLIKYKSDASQQEIDEMNNLLRGLGPTVDMKEFYNRSQNYFYNQMLKIVPLLICTILLIVVSTISISALNIKNNIKLYSVFYVCGSNRRKCLCLCLFNSILTVVIGIAITYIIMSISNISGALGQTVIQITNIGILMCAVAVVVHIVCSMIMPVVLMNKNSLIENLTENE